MSNLAGDSSDASVPAVKGTDTSLDRGGKGVQGTSDNGWGVYGRSTKGRGVEGFSEKDYGVRAHSEHLAGLRASSVESPGVEGQSNKGHGILGSSTLAHGVWGQTQARDAAGVRGSSTDGVGVLGESTNNEAVRGVCSGPRGGVVGVNTSGGPGIYGTSDNGTGVWGVSVTSEGMHAETKSTTTSAMAVYQMEPGSNTAALFVAHAGEKTAAFFKGNVIVTGDITLANADCAEDFDISAGCSAEPGTVMVLADEGALRESFRPYDKRVAGVISGAGNYKPAMILDRQPGDIRRPVALLGKVFCKVDAQFGPIEVGDLLTTSPTAGHAMRVSDPHRAFGSVIGKALRPLASGAGLIPILIALQ